MPTATPRATYSRYSTGLRTANDRQREERIVAQHRAADHVGGDAGQHDRAEGLGGEVTQDQLHREERCRPAAR